MRNIVLNQQTIDDMVNLINFFHAAISNDSLKILGVNSDNIEIDAMMIQDTAIKNGYIVMPDAYNSLVFTFLNMQSYNPGSTFYKTWESVVAKDRFELFVDQITHYANAYVLGKTWVPEKQTKDLFKDVEYDKYTIIKAVSALDMTHMCLDVLKSGCALKSDVVGSMVRYMIKFSEKTNWIFPIDQIKNKEAKILYYDLTGTWPNKGEDIVRYICYKATGIPMIIINQETIDKIKDFATHTSIELNENQMKECARVFLRFKPLFLALKDEYRVNSSLVNKLRKMSDKYHKPMAKNIWDNILSNEHNLEDVEKSAKELNNFRLITLCQAVIERIKLNMMGGPEMYKIRNGKTFIRQRFNSDRTIRYVDEPYLSNLLRILKTQLINNMKSKACVVKFPKDLVLACPTSQKNFIGEMPFGSYYNLGKKDVVFGIYWRGEWGTQDFDLSYMGFDGSRIGWNSNYYNFNNPVIFSGDMIHANPVIFSGDMIHANPEATELMYCSNGCPEGLIYNNRFNGKEGSQFRFFAAVENIKDKLQSKEKYYNCKPEVANNMVDPGKVKISEMMTSTKRETQVGVILGNKVYFVQLDLRDTHTANGINVNDFRKIYERKTTSFLYVKNILKASGFQDYDEINKDKTEEELVPYDIDLTQCNKSTLIDLFS